MPNPEREEVEITSRFVLHDTILSVGLLIGAAVVEFLKTLLFPHGVPFATNVVLFLGELAMVGMALRHVARIFVWLLPVSEYVTEYGNYIGKVLATADKIGPAGWGVICALVFLAVAAFSFIIADAPKWLYSALWLLAIFLWIGALVRAKDLPAITMKMGISFITVPIVLALLVTMLMMIAFILNEVFGGGITARSIIEWVARRGT